MEVNTGRLDGKVALVTGGGRGQGRAHAVALAEAGADIAVCDIVEQVASVPYDTGRPGDLDETVRLIEELDRRCVAGVVDVREHQALSAFTQAVVAELGSVDILVANAGIFSFNPIQDVGPGQWAAMIDVCLTGVYNAIQAVAPIMIEKTAGRIIATSSFAARGAPAANIAHYIAAKAGVIGLVQGTAIDLAPYNITANVVCPVSVDTLMMRNDAMRRLFCPELEHPTDEDVDRKIAALGLHPLLDPRKVSQTVLLLASDEANDISGRVFDLGTSA
jgi:SDR family mycofactocin-dependent oxidoreductase